MFKRELLVRDDKTGEVVHRIDVSNKDACRREKVYNGLYRKLDWGRFHLDETIEGMTVHKARGGILEFLDEDSLSEFTAEQIALHTGYSVSWCRATAQVLARLGLVDQVETPSGMRWRSRGEAPVRRTA